MTSARPTSSDPSISLHTFQRALEMHYAAPLVWRCFLIVMVF